MTCLWCLRIVFNRRESLFDCVQETTASFIYIVEGSSLTPCRLVNSGLERSSCFCFGSQTVQTRLGLLDPEHGGATNLRKVGTYSPVKTAKHSTRVGYSAVPLRVPEVSHLQSHISSLTSPISHLQSPRSSHDDIKMKVRYRSETATM